MGRQNAAPINFDPKPFEAAFSIVFSNFDKCRPEAVSDDISGVAVEVGMDAHVKLGDSRLNSGRTIRLYTGRTRFTLVCSILLHFAADRKQLVIKCPAGL